MARARVALAGAGDGIQCLIPQGAGVGVVHDLALPATPGVRRVLARGFGLTRAFHLIRHADDRAVARLNRVAAALTGRLSAAIARLEAAIRCVPDA